MSSVELPPCKHFQKKKLPSETKRSALTSGYPPFRLTRSPTNKTTREKTTARRARFTAAAGEALRAGCPRDTHEHGAAPLGTGAATDPQCLSLMGKYRVTSLVGSTSKQTESLRCCECPRAFSRRGGAPGAPRDSAYREPRAPLRLPSSC